MGQAFEKEALSPPWGFCSPGTDNSRCTVLSTPPPFKFFLILAFLPGIYTSNAALPETSHSPDVSWKSCITLLTNGVGCRALLPNQDDTKCRTNYAFRKAYLHYLALPRERGRGSLRVSDVTSAASSLPSCPDDLQR